MRGGPTGIQDEKKDIKVGVMWDCLMQETHRDMNVLKCRCLCVPYVLRRGCLLSGCICFLWAGEDKEEAEEQRQGQRPHFSHNPQHHLRLSVRQWEGAEFGCLQHCGHRYYTPIGDPLGFVPLPFNEPKITVYRRRSAVYACTKKKKNPIKCP